MLAISQESVLIGDLCSLEKSGQIIDLFNFVGHRNHPGSIIRIELFDYLDHSFFKSLFDNLYLSRPKFELDTEDNAIDPP
jgi:hypothetical protein